MANWIILMTLFSVGVARAELEHKLEPVRVVDIYQTALNPKRGTIPDELRVSFYVETCTDETMEEDYQTSVLTTGRVQRLRFIRVTERDCDPDRPPFQKLLEKRVVAVRDMKLVPLLIHNPILRSLPPAPPEDETR